MYKYSFIYLFFNKTIFPVWLWEPDPWCQLPGLPPCRCWRESSQHAALHQQQPDNQGDCAVTHNEMYQPFCWGCAAVQSFIRVLIIRFAFSSPPPGRWNGFARWWLWILWLRQRYHPHMAGERKVSLTKPTLDVATSFHLLFAVIFLHLTWPPVAPRFLPGQIQPSASWAVRGRSGGAALLLVPVFSRRQPGSHLQQHAGTGGTTAQATGRRQGRNQRRWCSQGKHWKKKK